MKKLFTFLLALAMLASCATVVPSTKAVEKELAVHTVFFTVLEDCPVENSEACKYSAISIIDKIGIVDNMTLSGFNKIGIKKTADYGIWEFVRDSEEAERIIPLSAIKPQRVIISTK